MKYFFYILLILTSEFYFQSQCYAKISTPWSFQGLAQLSSSRAVPKKSFQQAMEYFRLNQFKISNQKYISIINYAQKSYEKRFYIIELKSGHVLSLRTAHGRGSDPSHSGIASTFSNDPGSNASSLGYFLTAETYEGAHGLSLKLDGLSPSNDSARDRALVIHGADYVKEKDTTQGRSFGCPAVAMEVHKKVINMLKNGSLIYAAYEPLKN